MAVVYRCDRCKTIGDDVSFLTAVVVPATSAVIDQQKQIVAAVDQVNKGICHDCLSKLRAFFESA